MIKTKAIPAVLPPMLLNGQDCSNVPSVEEILFLTFLYHFSV